MPKRLKLAVLLSGGGTTLKNLLDWSESGRLCADVKLVISSREGAGGLTIARDAAVATEVVASKSFITTAREGERVVAWRAMSKELDRVLLGGDFDLVCMAGFLCRYMFSPELADRVLNIHPSLIPMFCGEGMYGHHVHEAVVAAGLRVTGCTVHFADQTYDTGPIILQRCCPVYSDDTPADVASRVFVEECRAYPTAINLLAERRVGFIGSRRTYIDNDREIERFGDNDD